MQGMRVQSPVRDLKILKMPPKNQNIRQKQYCNKFNKDLKRLLLKKKESLVDDRGTLFLPFLLADIPLPQLP